MAERVGFEPTVGYKPTPVFKTGTFNRSVTSPNRVTNIETRRIQKNALVFHPCPQAYDRYVEIK